MKLHETALNARILQSGTTLIYRITPNSPANMVKNAVDMSRKVTACADSCPNYVETLFHQRVDGRLNGMHESNRLSPRNSCTHISQCTETSRAPARLNEQGNKHGNKPQNKLQSRQRIKR